MSNHKDFSVSLRYISFHKAQNRKMLKLILQEDVSVSCLPEGDLKFSLTNLNCISYVKSQRLLSFPTIYLISQSSKQKIAEIMRKKEESRNL